MMLILFGLRRLFDAVNERNQYLEQNKQHSAKMIALQAEIDALQVAQPTLQS